MGLVGDYTNLNLELKNPRDWRKGNSEKISDDIIDLLPSDPFGMDISARFLLPHDPFGMDPFGMEMGATLARFTGFLEELDNDLGDWLCKINIKSDIEFSDSSMNKVLHDESPLDYRPETNLFPGYNTDGSHKCDNKYLDGHGGTSPEALVYALRYLGVKDLLSVKMVCRSLNGAVENDPLLWRNVQIDHPLSEVITDEILLQLTSRAGGTLQSLSLVECFKITDDGLKRVIERNPMLTKLSVPGCIRLTVEGILDSFKALKSAEMLRVKQLRIGGLHGVKEKQFDELNSLLAVNTRINNAQKPRFYGGGLLYLSLEDDRPIDVEPCPRCRRLCQVYDCPLESCQANPTACRGCTLCIARCIKCGCCLTGRDYEETFCFDFLCLDCWKVVFQERRIIKHQASYHFCVYG